MIKIYPLSPSRQLITSLLFGILRLIEAVGLAHFSGKSRAGKKTEKQELLSEFRGISYDSALAFERYWVCLRHLNKKDIIDQGQDFLSEAPKTKISQEAIESTIEQKFVGDNRIELLSSNEKQIQKRIELIEGAVHSVTACFWVIKFDETGGSFITHLATCIRRGVKVTLALCHDTVRRQIYINSDYYHFLTRMVELGIDLHLIRYHDWNTYHRKMFVVDHEYALIGGRNIGNPYAIDGLEDSFIDDDLFIHGPGANTIEHVILKAIYGKKLEVKAPDIASQGEARLAIVGHVPNVEAKDLVVQGILDGIRHAKKSIDLAFGYFMAPPSMQEELIQAYKRGVLIRVLTNSKETVDYPLWSGAAYQALASLIAAGIEVYLMKTQPLHCKFAVIDKKLSIIGSHNLWPISSLFDYESNAFVFSQKLGKDFEERFNELLIIAKRVDQDKGVPVHMGRLERFCTKNIYAWYVEQPVIDDK